MTAFNDLGRCSLLSLKDDSRSYESIDSTKFQTMNEPLRDTAHNRVPLVHFSHSSCLDSVPYSVCPAPEHANRPLERCSCPLLDSQGYTCRHS